MLYSGNALGSDAFDMNIEPQKNRPVTVRPAFPVFGGGGGKDF